MSPAMRTVRGDPTVICYINLIGGVNTTMTFSWKAACIYGIRGKLGNGKVGNGKLGNRKIRQR